MKRFLFLSLAFILIFSFLSVSALAEGHISVVEKNLIEFDADDNAYLFAIVTNDGDAPIAVDSGKLVGFSKDDDIIVSESYIWSSPNSILLAPGESAYIREFIWESALEKADIADYKFSVEADTYGYTYEKIPFDSVTYKLDGSLNNYIYVTITNNTDEVWNNTYVVFALRDTDNNLIFVDTSYYDYLGIHPNSTITFRKYIDSDMLKHYAAHNIEIACAEAVAYEYVK